MRDRAGFANAPTGAPAGIENGDPEARIASQTESKHSASLEAT
jgi:hypothetical protein